MHYGIYLGLVSAACTSAETVPDPVVDSGQHVVDSDSPGVDTEDSAEDSAVKCTGPVEVELGSAPPRAAFATLDDGASLSMVHGPQGGWHVWLAFRVRGAPQGLILQYRVVDVATGTVFSDADPLSTSLFLVPLAGASAPWACEGTAVGLYGFLDFSQLGALSSSAEPWRVAQDHEIRVEGSVLDGSRLLGQDDMRLVLRPDACDLDRTASGCPCDPDASFIPPFCTDSGG